MKAEVVLKKEYRGCDLIVRKVSYEPREIPASLYPINDHWYCGYVVIPEYSPLYEADYQDLEDDIRVHGGLTFSGRIEGVDGYLLGFDCNHAWDDPHVQDEKYTLKECKSLADQLISLEESIKRVNNKDKAEEKTYRYEVYCEIDVKASSGVEARKKLKEDYGSFFHTFIGIVNENGEVEDED